MKPQLVIQERPLTLAEVCEAIAAGRLPAQVADGYYTVTQRALRQLRRQADSRVALSNKRPADLAS